MSVRAAIVAASTRLADVSDTARLDAELLMAHALGIERDRLLLDGDRLPIPDGFAAMVERRMAHEPVAYIIGYRDFWTIRLAVGPGVLIPRPDSETLIEAALAHFPERRAPLRILDLGTGPGTLLLAVLSELPEAHGLGIDASDVALDYARANAASLGLDDRAVFRTGDWATGLGGVFDLILCNPPYVESDTMLDRQVADFEPAGALFAGPEGLDEYRRILPMLPPLLTPDGLAVVEIGAGQRDAVSALAELEGLRVKCRSDLAGRDRAILCQQP
ncbi:peptide chain release factor N(5)-glutamine methyltransferase [Sphingomonas lacunae]|uniref:Release factor glutamine methyltransferase n=1 Tax=Sphingomonas lacunae TaxID=2698828 RepID=A0A6M4AYE1_9SPHN|nr:peptide chain release factor N(5)-glutamine methyltransferase [Sphingomonas lacunae]QJQ32021.1 peptide chain release factor N(5)-glutamine methyltransferase [Sphingomonas lacunae]